MHHEETHVNALLENRPDVLSSTVSLLHRRAFEPLGFTLGPTERTDVARLTVVVAGGETEADRLARELGRLVHVLCVDAQRRPAVDRSLALIKVSADAESRMEMIRLCEVFGARVVDVAPATMVVELSAGASRLDGFLEVLRPFGIVEMACSGPLSIDRADRVLGGLESDHHPSSWAQHRARARSRSIKPTDPEQGETP